MSLNELGRAFCRWLRGLCPDEEEPPFHPEDHKMSWQELKRLYENSFPEARLYIWDSWYYYTRHEDWGVVLEDVLLGMPEYTTQRFDCENFATLCACRVSSRYLINTMAIAIGKQDGNPHGFNVFVSSVDGEPQLFLLEPQTGMVYPVSEPEGYAVDYAIFG